MNNDLISKSAAIAAVERREKYLIGDKRIDVNSVKNFLTNRPTVDAEPVKRAKWKKVAGDRIICSNCGNDPLYDCSGKQKLTDYCCHCGAKMRGRKHETN